MNAFFSNPFVVALISTFIVSSLIYILEYFIRAYRNKSNIMKANNLVISKIMTYMFTNKGYDEYVLGNVIVGISKTLSVKQDKMYSLAEFRSILILKLIEDVTFNLEEKRKIISEVLKIEMFELERELEKSEEKLEELYERKEEINKTSRRNRRFVSLLMIIYMYIIFLVLIVYVFRDEFTKYIATTATINSLPFFTLTIIATVFSSTLVYLFYVNIKSKSRKNL